MSTTIPKTAKVYRLPSSKEQYTDATALRIVEEPVPVPGTGEVLVKIHAAAINFRDVLVAAKLFPGDYPPDLIPFSDAAGEIVALGEGASKFAIGDRVVNAFFAAWADGRPKTEYIATARGGTIHGVLTQYAVFSTEELALIPSYLSYEEASTLPCTGVTVYRALFSQEPYSPAITADSSILTLGTGPMSLLGIQLAKAVGARIIVTSSSDEKIKTVVEKYGAYGGVNYVTHAADWPEEVKKLTDGRGVNHILESGGPATLLQSLQTLASDGHVHLIGSSAKGPDPSVAWLAGAAVFSAAHIHGIYVGSRADQEKLFALLEKHEIHPIVDKVFDFGNVVDAYAYFAKAQGLGKVVVKVQE